MNLNDSSINIANRCLLRISPLNIIKYGVGQVQAPFRSISSYQKQRLTHVIRLDYDDILHPKQLELHAKSYSLSKRVGFVFTRALINSKAYPFHAAVNKKEAYFLPPILCIIAHSSISWSLKLFNLSYRRDYDQGDCHRNLIMASDADLLQRVSAIMQQNKTIRSVFRPRPTVSITSLTDKMKFLLLSGIEKREYLNGIVWEM